jgi:hypothetical protein
MGLMNSLTARTQATIKTNNESWNNSGFAQAVRKTLMGRQIIKNHPITFRIIE